MFNSKEWNLMIIGNKEKIRGTNFSIKLWKVDSSGTATGFLKKSKKWQNTMNFKEEMLE